MTHSQYTLLTEQRFHPFFFTQFLGALNDNLYKNALVILLTYQISKNSNWDADLLVNLSAGLFILPFFLFSATAGQLADKYEKTRLIRLIKLAEIGIMIIGSAGLYWNNLFLLLTALFLMGTHSSFFGPIKYGILPQQLHTEELIGGNALIEMGTFLAILLGTILGGVLIGIGEIGHVLAGLTAIAVATLGWWISLRIPKAEPVDPALKVNWNLLQATFAILKHTRQNRTVFLSVLGISWFWLYGAFFLAQFPHYTKEVLHGSEGVVTLLLAIFSLGIGAGSLWCEKLAAYRIELGLVPFGSIGLTLFALDLALASPSPAATSALMGVGTFLSQPSHWHILFDLAMIALFGGFYIVPLYALVQTRSEPEHRSRVIAANNILNALFMVAAAIAAIILLKAGLSIPHLFLTMGIINAAVAIYIYRQLPEFLLRLVTWLLVRTIYKLKEQELHNIPETGPAVLVCNHVSFVDALIITAACRRPIRFVMDHRIFKTPIMGYIFRAARTIPIASAKEDPEMLNRAFDTVAKALEEGELVCIFPEGKITHDGEMNPFRPGIEKIIERTPVPVIPLALRGLFGSFFSRMGGRAMHLRNLPGKLWQRIAIVSGLPVLPEQVSAALLQEKVVKLRGEWR